MITTELKAEVGAAAEAADAYELQRFVAFVHLNDAITSGNQSEFEAASSELMQLGLDVRLIRRSPAVSEVAG